VLERFLRRIASHPEIADSEIFLNFLQNDPSALSRFKEARAALKPKLSTSAMNWLEGTVSSLTSKGEVEKSAADQKIEEIGSYIQQLEKQMSSTIKHSEALVKRSRDISQAIFELGQSLTYLGQSEGDALGTGLTQVSHYYFVRILYIECLF
jgi:sorting nexin-1/2